MGNLPLVTRPRNFFISDEETRTGQTVMSNTWRGCAELINYLNFYARRILPWNCWEAQIPGKVGLEFVFPCDPPDYTQRWLLTLWAIYCHTEEAHSATPLIMTVTSTTDESGADYDTVTHHLSAGTSGPAYADHGDTDEHTVYAAVPVKVQGNARNLITGVMTAAWSIGDCLVGFGAWEIPGRDKSTAMGAGGELSNKFPTVPDGTATVALPSHYYIAKDIDTDIDEVEDNLRHAWARNRAILLNVGATDVAGGGGGLSYFTTATTGAWTSVTGGEGLYIPPYCVQEGETTFKCRVVVKAKNSSSSGTTQWGVVTIADPTPPATTDSIVNDSTTQWRPCHTSGNFDGSVDGIEFEVAAGGEWIDIEVYNPVPNGASAVITIYQIIVWAQEDEPS